VFFDSSKISGGSAPDAPLLPHAAALISACRIEPHVPPTAKLAKDVVRRRFRPLRTLSGLYFLNPFFFETQVNSATISPLDEPFLIHF
jgi:hypothetical protein